MNIIYKDEYERKTYSHAEIESYASQDLVIGYRGTSQQVTIPQPSSDDLNSDVRNSNMPGEFVEVDGTATYYANIQKTLYRFTGFNNRKIGVVLGQNDDLSLKIAILGSETFKINGNATKRIERYYFNNARVNDAGEGRFPFPAWGTWITSDSSPNLNQNQMAISKFRNSQFLTIDDAFNHVPNWNELSGGMASTLPAFFNNTCKVNGVYLGPYEGFTDIQLTNNSSTSFVVGDGVECEHYQLGDDSAKYGANVYDCMAGDLYTMMYEYAGYWSTWASDYAKHFIYDFYDDHRGSIGLYESTRFNGGTYAWQWVPYNLILTENETEAQEYLRSGRIPSDAWIYPWNPDEFPMFESSDPGDDPGDDPDGGDGGDPENDPIDDLDDMPIENPVTTPQQLNPNNVYWLQKGQLLSFFQWFWMDAGKIIDAGDLWEKIIGLYNDLGSCIINVRYMPVDVDWIGGSESVKSIIIGQIEKGGEYLAIKKTTKQTPRYIGEYDLSELKNNFTDYSPHSEVSLYLPFYGYMSIDNDLLKHKSNVNKKLAVYAIYDYLSGTIQYLIYCKKGSKKSLINTCIAKMAVDVPITLQSKSDRDSAIFNNVMNATSNLMSAGVSLAMKNPVGFALSVGGTLSAGQNSAMLNVRGAQGESGAFFCPQNCAIIIKQSFYKRPSNYNMRVGYPCYKTYEMAKLKGKYITVINPYITFKGNLYSSSGIKNKIYPQQNEINEIYEALSKGVIL